MVGIICAMDGEIGAIRERMAASGAPIDEKSVGAAGRAFAFARGKIDGTDVVTLKCGIGKVAAGIGAALLIENYAPSCVINTGSAGGIDPSLKVGDVVLGSFLVQHDVDVTAFGRKLGEVPGLPPLLPGDENLLAAAEKALKSLQNDGTLPADLRCVRGLIASGDQFFHRDEQIARLRAAFPAVQAVEMESAAIAHAAYLFNTPCLIIRALSDVAGKESPVSSEEYLPIAARHSAEIALRMLRRR